ncbi:helix-turn-helix transcriptional regulator [Nonomuraea jabiensis]|uniref:DNA-binding CsgD family transcriptional regulator n=1 Tax=Nonomuraea jabiensis TaxID=882448 RepID=A0A7W9G7F9_9ACTN|nr:AAA family ATPase [Nonomuraea jabiensis]MBB5778622.1 DNA-binding CsgD family transcriptional regulator [Nonomuraea jabiensis]
MLRGRESEQQAIDVLLDQARAGRSGVLVLGGEPGIGKTALLTYAGERAQDMRVLRGLGVETEAEIPYASLHLLLRGALGHLDALPEPQAAALAGALGLAPARADDRFHVGVAVLSLLAELAEDRPLLCLVDDAHWLDPASAVVLRFAAHRLHAEGVVMLFGARDGFDPGGLPERRLSGLDDGSAARVLADAAPGLTGSTRLKILKESAGNPLALLELPRTADLPFYDHSPLPLPERLRLAYAARVGRLPQAARTALLVTALADDGDLNMITKACAALGVELAALGAAERAGLVTIAGRQVRFAHPLMRAAVFQLSTYDLRLAVHQTLAGLLADRPDRRAWHLAAAATGPDEAAARALEDLARRAGERGASVSACTAFERAAELSQDEELKGRRLLSAAVHATEAGQPQRAQRLVEAATALVPATSARTTLPKLRARIALDQGAPHLAHDLLLKGAADVAGDDRAAAGLMLVEAARNANRFGDAARLVEAADRLRELDLRPEDDLDLARQAALGTALLLTEGPAAALPIMRELVSKGSRITPEMHSRRINASYFALQTGDFQAAWEIARAAADECRANGELGKLAVLHITLAASEIFLGRFTDATATATEGLHLTAETGRPSRAGCMRGMLAWIAAARGDADRCAELAAAAHEHYDANGIVNGLAWAQWARALLDLGLGRHAEVLDRLETALAGPARHQFQAVHFAPDQIEAAARLGLPADRPLRRYEAWAEASGQTWAQAVLHRCRALLEPDGERAHDHFRTAVRLHAGGGHPWESARTALVYGERLRRDRHKGAARAQLRAALETFQRLGARPWADRAGNELRAAGDTGLVAAGADALSALSPQELQIVRLAAAGRTNKEIGAQLFLSPKTVSYHLYRAFPKLNVTSRAQLAGLDLA